MSLTVFKRRARRLVSIGILATAVVTIIALVQTSRDKLSSLEASAFWETAVMLIIMATILGFVILMLLHRNEDFELEVEVEPDTS